MYAELLQTPHPSKLAENEQSKLLLESINLPAVHDRLAQADGSESYASAVIDEADMISRHVKKALRFETGYTSQNGLQPETMEKSQVSDCFGYTQVVSECLEAAGIPHYLGYTNGHAFTVVSDGISYAWMIDGLSPVLNGDMKPAINEYDFAQLVPQLQTHQRGAVRFSAADYARTLKLSDSYDALCQKNPWMKSKSFMKDPRTLSIKELQREQTLVITLFEAKTGREVFENLRNFQAAYAMQAMSKAYKYLRAIDGMFPDMDSRNSMPSVRTFIRDLATKGYLAMASAATEGVAASFSKDISQDARLHMWRGDRLRDIGRVAQSTVLLTRAYEAYQEDAPRQTKLLEEKLLKTERMIRTHTH